MTVEKKYAKRFNGFVAELLEEKERNQNLLSILDRKLSDCLHFLENEKANAATLSKINKKIRELRQERREVKNTLIDINNVLNRFKNTKKMNEVSECEYEYRTEILVEILSE